MDVRKGGCMSTQSCLVSVDALVMLLLARQSVKRRIGDVNSPLGHNLPYGDDIHNATQSA